MTPQDPPRAGAVMKMLPKETWDIDTPTSLFYFAVDLLAVASTMGFLDVVVTSDNYHALPVWAQAVAVAPLQVLTGFAMWYVFRFQWIYHVSSDDVCFLSC